MLYGYFEQRKGGVVISSLNPYFFGKCSTAHGNRNNTEIPRRVLILIFLENALRQGIVVQKYYIIYHVLILIFLENALRLFITVAQWKEYGCLNPYFFGKCSTAHIIKRKTKKCKTVLILIFLENALRLALQMQKKDSNVS